MASGAASSRRTKKVPVENRGRRKNANKSLKRRRVSSSPSSCFSDSDDDSRNRRRRVDSRRKPEKRRGRDKKRSENRKNRRLRGRNVSSSWDSSSSCSTCRSRSIDSFGRSMSPVRHQEFKKGKRKIRSRGRKLDRRRKMSSSCSTCSGSSSWSWSSGRRQSCREERRKEKGDLGRKGKRRENDDFGLRGSSVMDALGDAEGKCGSEGQETNTQMNNQNYDFLQGAGGIVEHNFGRVEQDEMMDPGYYDQATEVDRWMDEGKVEKDFYFVQSKESAFGRQEAHSLESYQCGKSYFQGSNGSHTYEFKYNSETGRRIKSEVVVVDKICSESDDLELLLRQKALENLKKLKEEQSVNNRSSVHRKSNSDGAVCSEKPCITVKSSIATSESDTIFEKDVLVGAPLHESKVNSFIEQLANKANDDYNPDKRMVFTGLSTSRTSKQFDKDNIIFQSASVGANSGGEILKKISSEQTPNGGSQEKVSSAAECRTSLGHNDAEKIGGSHENMDAGKQNGSQENLADSGSQFEQKTFSRMHDGEMVQVSYKVYIPKKTPALARRKLQR